MESAGYPDTITFEEARKLFTERNGQTVPWNDDGRENAIAAGGVLSGLTKRKRKAGHSVEEDTFRITVDVGAQKVTKGIV